MSVLRANPCWPKQFVAKWLAVFFAAFIVGVLIPAITNPVRLVQANIQISVQYGSSAPQATAADISLLDSPGAPWDNTKVFSTVFPKSLPGPGLKYFLVWPKNSQGEHEGDAQAWTVEWPNKANEGKTLSFTVVRSYPTPNWHQ